jgi:hypothetical protein
MKSGSLFFMSVAAVLLTGCPLPPYGDGPPPGCQGPNCGDDDDDDDNCGGKGGYGGSGQGGTSGKAGSGGYGGSGGSGSVRTPIGLDEYQQILRQDLTSLPRAEQSDTVYVEFHAAYNNNNRFSDDELGVFANATLKLLNQLDVLSTSAGNQGAAVVLSGDGVPVAVRFNTKRFNLDKQRDIVDTIARLTNRQDSAAPFACDVVAVPGLDFLHIASRDDVFNAVTQEFDSGYANVALIKRLESAGFAQPGDRFFNPIPEQQFIANGFANIANFDAYQLLEAVDPANLNRAALDQLYNGTGDRERLTRGCLLNSNASAATRCLDRFAQSSPSGGATYLSFDAGSFLNNGGNNDIFAAGFFGPGNPAGDPLVPPQGGAEPFLVDGGTGLFQLPNQMLGFFAFNGNFQLVSNSSTYAVSWVADDGTLDLEASGGGSLATCNSCHGAAFAVPFADQMLPALLNAPSQDPTTLGFAFRLAQSQDDWDATFALDAALYQEALRNVYVTQNENGDLPDAIGTLGSQYSNDMTADDVAAEIGLPSGALLCDVLDNEPGTLGALAPLCGEGGISRETYTLNYQNLVDLIAIGPADFLRGCIAREASEPGDTGDDPGGN